MTLGLQHSDKVNGEPPISLTVFPTHPPKGIARGHCFGPGKITDFSIVTQTLKQLQVRPPSGDLWVVSITGG